MLTAEEIARGLIAQGVPRDRAEAQARREAGCQYVGRSPLIPDGLPIAPGPLAIMHVQLTGFAPITLRIPWSALVSDNALYVVREGKRYRTAEYKAAQKAVASLARDTMRGRPLYDAPLAITFRFWVPNGQRRDVHNFIAGLADSLKGVVWTDDHWLHEGTWRLVGRDIDAPRAELTISPLSP
jgi:Holliday junction resolvase RusA-like endonuclease